MSKKKYSYEYGKEVGCNTVRGWLLTEEQIGLVRYFLILAGIQFKFDAKKNLRNGDPKSLTMHEMRKYREVTALYNDLVNLKPHVYEMV